MKRIFAVAVTLLTVFITPASLSAKGDIVKIKITGGALATPIEITDPSIRSFEVWAGPGVHVNDREQTEGFIIDWSSGPLQERPKGLRPYEVSFYEKGRLPEERLVYVVEYAYDPSSEQGYVYLPGKGDEGYRLNASSIFRGHGLEGHWFRATGAWENFVRPILRRAPMGTSK